MSSIEIVCGEAFDVLQTLPDEFAHCCVTSPPYYGLRDYGVSGQIGLERTPGEYVEKLVRIFQEVRRVLREDGTCWVNMGDSYASGKGTCYNPGGNTSSFNVHLKAQNVYPLDRGNVSTLREQGLKPKDLMGMPWRVAFALQADGWWLRQDIIWHKPNPMPESVPDRCTKAHEYIFLLTKSAKYYYNQDAIREITGHEMSPQEYDIARKHQDWTANRGNTMTTGVEYGRSKTVSGTHPAGRNKRSVWTIATKPYPKAHFATFPPEIPRLCISAGCPEGGTVLDPFSGAGTTGLVASQLDRSYIGVELNQEYVELSRDRIYNDAPLFNGDALCSGVL